MTPYIRVGIFVDARCCGMMRIEYKKSVHPKVGALGALDMCLV